MATVADTVLSNPAMLRCCTHTLPPGCSVLCNHQMPDYDNSPQSYILPVFPKGIYLHAQTQATPKLADNGGHFSPTISHNSHNQFTFLPECKFTKKFGSRLRCISLHHWMEQFSLPHKQEANSESVKGQCTKSGQPDSFARKLHSPLRETD